MGCERKRGIKEESNFTVTGGIELSSAEMKRSVRRAGLLWVGGGGGLELQEFRFG